MNTPKSKISMPPDILKYLISLYYHNAKSAYLIFILEDDSMTTPPYHLKKSLQKVIFSLGVLLLALGGLALLTTIITFGYDFYMTVIWIIATGILLGVGACMAYLGREMAKILNE
ncbi:MAG: hypothetical protein ACFFCI_22420 [Promethearchaeota archaeon]